MRFESDKIVNPGSTPKRGLGKRKILLVFVLAGLVILSLFFVTAASVPASGKAPLWVYRTSGTINSIAMSENGSYIAVGVGFTHTSGGLFLFDSTGRLLWERAMDHIMSDVTISGNGSRIVANGYTILPGPAGVYANPEVYAFDSSGNLLWSRASSSFPFFGGLAANGSKVTIATAGSIALLTWQNLVLWNYSAPPSYPTGNYSVPETNTNPAVFVSQNGSRVVAGPNGITMLGSGENNIWTYEGFTPVPQSATALTPEGYLFAVGTETSGVNGTVLLASGAGSLLWKHHVDSAVLSGALLPNASTVGFVTNWNALFYDRSGMLLANFTTDGTAELLPAFNGLFLLGGGDGNGLVLFNSTGRMMWSYPMQSDLTEAISSDGSFTAAASGLGGQGGAGYPSTLYVFSTTRNGGVSANLEGQLLNYSASPYFTLFEIGTGVTLVALFAALAFMVVRRRSVTV